MTTLVFHFLMDLLYFCAGNKVSHKSLDGFEFRQDFISDFGVSCP